MIRARLIRGCGAAAAATATGTVAAGALLLWIGGCTLQGSKDVTHAPAKSTPVPTASPPAPGTAAAASSSGNAVGGSTAMGGAVEELAAAVARDAQRSDVERDAKVREQLAADAQVQAQACLQRAPQAPACLYYQGVALGLQARAHPLRAGELLKSMLASLTAAEAADPGYDNAGPERVKALVLVRAPSWPLGPGDIDTGLAEARRAVQLQPEHPPNQLALAEALSKSGDAADAREAYQRAHDLAQGLPASADRDDWLKQADQGLRAP